MLLTRDIGGASPATSPRTARAHPGSSPWRARRRSRWPPPPRRSCSRADRRRTRLAARRSASPPPACVVVVAYAVARALALGSVRDPDDRAAAAAVWDAFLGDLRDARAGCSRASGAVVAAAAASLIRPVALEAPLRRRWRRATTEPHGGRRCGVARASRSSPPALLLIAAAAARAAARASTLAGVYVALQGHRGAAAARSTSPAEDAHAARAGRGAPPRSPRRGRGSPRCWSRARSRRSSPAAAPTRRAAARGRCNGHAALCDRPLDEVVLPATHNSMSAPLPGWFSAEQERPIGGQLEDGIRGLLLDTHYADRSPTAACARTSAAPTTCGAAPARTA